MSIRSADFRVCQKRGLTLWRAPQNPEENGVPGEGQTPFLIERQTPFLIDPRLETGGGSY